MTFDLDLDLDLGLTISAYRSCLKPCIDVTYATSVDKYFVSPEELGECREKGGKIIFQLSRYIEMEVVRMKLKTFRGCHI